MWDLDCEEGWTPKNWCFWTVVLEETLESLLDCKKIQPVHPKGNQFWVFKGRLKLKLQYFGHLMRRADSFEKTLMLGKIGGRRRRGQQRMRWWMVSLTQWTWVWVNSGSCYWTGGLALVHGVAESDTTEQLNWTELKTNKQKKIRWHVRVSYLYFPLECQQNGNCMENSLSTISQLLTWEHTNKVHRYCDILIYLSHDSPEEQEN